MTQNWQKLIRGQVGKAAKISLFAFALTSTSIRAFAQADQGAINGTVTDGTGAVVSAAQVTLTNTDTDLVLKTQTDNSGVYIFSPIKIGNYKVSITSVGFSTTTQENIQVHVQDRLEVNGPQDGRSKYQHHRHRFAAAPADRAGFHGASHRDQDDQRHAFEWTQLGLHRAADRRCRAGEWSTRPKGWRF